MLEVILIVAFGGAIISYLLGREFPELRNILTRGVWIAIVGLVSYVHFIIPASSIYYPGFLGFDLALRVDSLSWLFAITIASLGTLAIIFSASYIKGRERENFYYLLLLLVSGGMMGIVLSGDLVSLYIFWEIMSWSTFLLISYSHGKALAAGLRYIVMSVIGSGAMLVAILSLYAAYGTLNFSELPTFLATASPTYLIFLFLLFLTGFGIKNAILPFHTWLPPAHSEAPAPFSALLSGVLIKMGTYGLIVVFYIFAGTKLFLGLSNGIWSFHYILCALGAVTIVVPTFIAILQTDAKRLLAWSTVGQAGYIILGLTFGTGLAFVGGVFHFLNHALFKALLFLAIGAVEYRTSTRDLNSLGGLIKRMPVVFIAAVIGIGGLIGVPLTNGFYSKWLMYKTLILEGNTLLAFAAFIGTWGAILYSYKLIHNVFLGQLPEKYQEVKQAPLSMQFPLAILSVAIFVFGIFPGIAINQINNISTALGFSSLDVSLWGIVSDTGMINTLNILVAFIIVSAIVWYIFQSGAESPRVSQTDSYTSGAPVPEGKFNYTVDFYNPLERMMKPYLRDRIDDLYSGIVEFVKQLSNKTRKVFTGYVGTYVAYIVTLLAVIILIQLGWSIW